MEIIKRVDEDGFYKCYEIAPIYTKGARKELGRYVDNNNILLTNWITKDFIEQSLSPSTTDMEERKKVIERGVMLIEMAHECGVKNIALVSGQSTTGNIKDARKGLQEVLTTFCEFMKPLNMNLYLEPLDTFAHKKGIIGNTKDSAQIISKINKTCNNFYIAWDSAHMALNEDDLVSSVVQLHTSISQLHLSNAVLDKTSAAYGDYHMDLEGDGFLHKKEIMKILESACTLGLAENVTNTVGIEVRSKNVDEQWEKEKKYTRFLKEILNKEIGKNE